jgi:hypothetical protein
MAPRRSCAWIAAILAAALPLPAHAEDADGFRVRMARSQHAQSVRRALKGVSERLVRPECQKLFTDYHDQAGRPLQERLDALGLNAQEFLGFIGFYEGYGQTRCGQVQVLAFTQPGSLAVRICPQISRQDTETVEMILLHEMLHSLGLGENPPSTYEITRQVTKRCGGRDQDLKARAAKRS